MRAPLKPCLWIAILLLMAPPGLRAATRTELWQRVDAAVKQGLPRTAITNLEPIITQALAERAWADAVRAIGRKIVLEGQIEGNKPEERIRRIQAEVKKAPKEIAPLLRAIEADWYWEYFQNNRWRFLQRTAQTTVPSKDFTTWDLRTFLREIDRTFREALVQDLKQTPITEFAELLTKGSLPDSYRPTLFDFIAHEALKFYSSGELAVSQDEDVFRIAADSPVFAAPSVFMAWAPLGADTNAPAFRALRLYQEILKFHEDDADPSAFIDADLARLAWAYGVSVGADKETLYQSALQRFVDKWPAHPDSARAFSAWSGVLQGQGDLVEARRVASRGERAFPTSPGGLQCHNQIAAIDGKSLNVTAERVWNAPWPKLVVSYRNVSKVHFRVVAADWNEFLEKRHSRPESLNAQERADLLRKKPILEWSASLPRTVDFKERIEEVSAPTDLKKGFYFIIASEDPGFGAKENQVRFTDFWVSDLALVVKTPSQVEGLVVNAVSGEPMAGAQVEAWYLDQNANRVRIGPAQSVDANGWFRLTSPEQRPLLLRARVAGDELASMSEYARWDRPEVLARNEVVFFTDRALYRPGQTISYKGICVHIDQARNSYSAVGSEEIEIAFIDPNGKEISKAIHRSSANGSFSGSFSAPRDRVLGQFQIQARRGGDGAAWFNIEEYKRPKFQVTLNLPKTAPRLNEVTGFEGKAEAYTGAPIDGAAVRWRVVREVHWPIWWEGRGFGSRRGVPSSPSQEIAHGTSRTGSDGTFKIAFEAKPDPAVEETSEASFNFHAYADVTDSAGETRSNDKSIEIGFVALRASIAVNSWQTQDKPVTLYLKTTSLDGEPQKAEGALKIYQLKPPAKVVRPRLSGLPVPLAEMGTLPAGIDGLSDPKNWPEGEIAFQGAWTTDSDGKAELTATLKTGVYRVALETQDRYGKRVTSRCEITVLDPSAPKFDLMLPSLVTAPTWEAAPGKDFTAFWGTGYDSGRAFVEIEKRGQILRRFWTPIGVTQEQIKQSVDESMRGGFTIHVTQVRENRAYFQSLRVNVPWKNKELDVQWEHFVSKLQPGQKETWSAVIRPAETNRPSSASSGKDSGTLAAEMVATLYDESLDQFRAFDWIRRFHFFASEDSPRDPDFANVAKPFQYLRGEWKSDYRKVEISYRGFQADVVPRGHVFAISASRAYAAAGVDTLYAIGAQGGTAPGSAPLATLAVESLADGGNRQFFAKGLSAQAAPSPSATPPQSAFKVRLEQVNSRRNLNETAFFFPQLTSDSNGIVRMTFTMPEALTQWRFMGFAHDYALRSGFIEAHAVTAKEIMVQPNPPRFLREGDVLEFTVKVSNQSAARQTGEVRLSFADAATEASFDLQLENTAGPQSFDIPAKESRAFSWRLHVPNGAPFLVYKAVASTGRLSDGEEGYLPVLSRRILLTESLPLPIRVKAGEAQATKRFELAKLVASTNSETLVSQSLVLQMVSNPAWYAVLALPYLMEFPHECTEQTFNRLYANALARSIANADLKIRQMFDLWKNTPALDSPLEKNQDLKSVALEETPWLRQAESESQARKNVGILFDGNRLDSELERLRLKLTEAQLSDGRWPWFPGGAGDDFMTLYIVTGYGRLRHLGAGLAVDLALRAVASLDDAADRHYRDILKSKNSDDYVPTPRDALYLYGRSFFLKDLAPARAKQEAIDFFLRKTREHWLKVDCRQSQAHLALALKRFGGADNLSAARDIMRSLKERSVQDDEMGMFWRDLELSWWWYRAPIETQALMIEAFDEVAGDKEAVEECRVWLLKQKQTQDWKTTKATADAIYALLLRGADLLANKQAVEVTIGGTNAMQVLTQHARVRNERASDARDGKLGAIEPGTGFFEVRFSGSQIEPRLGEISLRKTDEGVAWGSVHWQYLEDMSKVTPHQGTPLTLRKSLYTRIATEKGRTLEPVDDAIAVGDELVVRIELRVDRDMEYVHLKDQRGSGIEPVNVLSRYRYQDGLAYYETTRDTASHFFINYLPKGTYVFEYASRVQHRGQYQSGVASIQCMYAPEFNSHSESLMLTVK